MRSLMRWCMFWLLVLAAPACAETRLALIVANSQYQDAALSNPSIDAGLVSKALADIGFDVTVVENASLEVFDASVQSFATKARGADLALFYFAGHGFAVTDRGVPRNYLMSTDADVTSTSERVLRAGGMPLDDIIEAISAEAKTTLVFMDACRNDPRVGRATGGRGRSAVAIDNTVGESVFVGLSTRLGDVASDGVAGNGSPFARAFAANVSTVGARLDDVFTEIRLAVEAETKRDQRPDVGRYDLLKPVILRPAGAPANSLPSGLLDPCRDAAAHWQAISALDQRALIEEHLRMFPSCAFSSLARLRLEESQPPPDAPETECDRLAARGPNDVGGVPFDRLDASRAIPACRTAVNSNPGVARLMFQLGRSLEKAENYTEAGEWYQKAAALGEVSSMYSLGLLYQDGRGVAQNYVEARGWYEKAVELGDATAMNNLGTLYEHGRGVSQDPAKAREWYEKAAALGNAIAMTNLGNLYDAGAGVTRNYVEARGWYEKAAALGEAGAMNSLGYLYNQGHGVPQDYVKAREWYEKAAALGNTWAINNLGALYQGGQGVERDSAKARELYERAAGLGNPLAMTNMGDLYSGGLGVPVDYAKAREWYEKAAALGNALAMNGLGYMYDQGNGVTRDYAKAHEWYEKAAALSEPWATNNIGAHYEDGHGVAQDYVKAREWYEKAAALGNALGVKNVADLYYNGLGVPQDFAKAREWYEKAAALGNASATNSVGYLYDQGLGVPQDYVKAFQWYEKAGALGEPWATNNLGVLYERGLGVAQDYAKAREWYEKAAALGNARAMTNLGGLYDNGRGTARDVTQAVRLVVDGLRKGDDFAAKEMKSNASNWSLDFRKALQARLKEAGVYNGKVDGQFGPATHRAVDAIFGSQT